MVPCAVGPVRIRSRTSPVLIWPSPTARRAGRKATDGSVTRCAPIAIVYREDRERLQRVSRDSSRVPHADPRCVHGCALLNLVIDVSLDDRPAPLERALGELPEDAPAALVEGVAPIPGAVDRDALVPDHDVVETLRTSLYHGLTADGAEAAIVAAVNEGGDADTVGARTGAVAGARFGAANLPERWLAPLERRSELDGLSADLVGVDPEE